MEVGAGAKGGIEGARLGRVLAATSGELPARHAFQLRSQRPPAGGERNIAVEDLRDRSAHFGRRQRDLSPLRRDDEILGGHADLSGQGTRQHRGPTAVAFQASDGRVVGRSDPAADQSLHRRLGHRRLTERRQHLRDVAQEHRVRPDDEHASIAEQQAVLVEQERGAVQPDRGLAGTRSALDDQARVEGARIIASCSAWIVATMSRI